MTNSSSSRNTFNFSSPTSTSSPNNGMNGVDLATTASRLTRYPSLTDYLPALLESFSTLNSSKSSVSEPETNMECQDFNFDGHDENFIQEQYAILARIKEDKTSSQPVGGSVVPAASTLASETPNADDIDWVALLNDHNLIQQQNDIIQRIQDQYKSSSPPRPLSSKPMPSTSLCNNFCEPPMEITFKPVPRKEARMMLQQTKNLAPNTLSSMIWPSANNRGSTGVPMLATGSSASKRDLISNSASVNSTASFDAAANPTYEAIAYYHNDSVARLTTGQKIRLRGIKHVNKALKSGTTKTVKCIQCQTLYLVPESASALLCVKCHQVFSIKLAQQTIALTQDHKIASLCDCPEEVTSSLKTNFATFDGGN